jgi:hypothetical protein
LFERCDLVCERLRACAIAEIRLRSLFSRLSQHLGMIDDGVVRRDSNW